MSNWPKTLGQKRLLAGILILNTGGQKLGYPWDERDVRDQPGFSSHTGWPRVWVQASPRKIPWAHDPPPRDSAASSP